MDLTRAGNPAGDRGCQAQDGRHRPDMAGKSSRGQMARACAPDQAISGPNPLHHAPVIAEPGGRLEKGGYRRDHVRAFAQHVEVADDAIYINGNKNTLLRTLIATKGGK